MSHEVWWHRRETSLHRIFFFSLNLSCCIKPAAMSQRLRRCFSWGCPGAGEAGGLGAPPAPDLAWIHPAALPQDPLRPFWQHHPASALIFYLLPEAVIFFHFCFIFLLQRKLLCTRAAGVDCTPEEADPAHVASFISPWAVQVL